jgi:maltooligosyltrehalose trehalohydrolase
MAATREMTAVSTDQTVLRRVWPHLGASYRGNGRCAFAVWGPRRERVELHLTAPVDRLIAMERNDNGYHIVALEDVTPGTRYLYRLDGEVERPDPASRSQPEGVHAPSEVVDPRAISWSDERWRGPLLEDLIFYELHVGTFTNEGTFDAAIRQLDRLRDLGITAVEIMPIAQFPGARNWGYDGVYPFAAQHSYGGLDGLQRFVDAAHQQGLAVFLDVVYNHLGPEGNYFGEYGPYFTDAYRTPWGSALNFDGPDSDHVRHYFIQNALYWLTECHLDGLRLDAVHAIRDFSAQPFLQELAATVQQRAALLHRRLYLIAESDLNDARLILPPDLGGFGLDAQWADDFHHTVHSLLTGERDGYYEDFRDVAHLARALRHGYVYMGDYSTHRRRRHGNSSLLNPARQFVVCIQNHDQVGNRMLGERLSQLVDFAALKQAAALLLLSPYLPLLFMGDEYGETAPFQYFTSHSDPALVEGVRRGRAEEFAAFAWRGDVPDPQAEATFERSRLHHELREEGEHRTLYQFYRELMMLRRDVPPLRDLSKERLEAIAFESPRVLYIRRWCSDGEVITMASFSAAPETLTLPIPPGIWSKMLDSTDPQWRGSGSTLPGTIDTTTGTTVTLQPSTFALYHRQSEATS